jgi:glycosyltransferase involved in cell wall biosynthesis
MKVAFIARPDLYSLSGGDTVQLDNTASALRMLGVEVDIRLADEQIEYSAYDLLHMFNMIDCEDLLKHALHTPVPYVLSTIFVDYTEYDRYHRGGVIGGLSRFFSPDTVEWMKKTAKFLLKGDRVSTYRYFLMGNRKSVCSILERAAFLLPNSHREYRRVVEAYGVERPYAVIPNAVDTRLFEYSGTSLERDIILCVARIEGRKNQLNLIRAVNGTPYRLILIGRPSVNQHKYVARCIKEAGENVTFIEHMTQPELRQYYLRAKVHVLASWFETTGLSSLEAAAMGCNIVVGDKGDVREYFGEFAYYCNPESIESIREAIIQAMNAKPSASLHGFIQENYNWNRAAQLTKDVYKRVLAHD